MGWWGAKEEGVVGGEIKCAHCVSTYYHDHLQRGRGWKKETGWIGRDGTKRGRGEGRVCTQTQGYMWGGACRSDAAGTLKAVC